MFNINFIFFFLFIIVKSDYIDIKNISLNQCISSFSNSTEISIKFENNLNFDDKTKANIFLTIPFFLENSTSNKFINSICYINNLTFSKSNTELSCEWNETFSSKMLYFNQKYAKEKSSIGFYCYSGYYLKGDECIKCPEGYTSKDKNFGEECIIDLNICSSLNSDRTRCSSCKAGYYLEDGKCIPCKSGTFSKENDNICSICEEGYTSKERSSVCDLIIVKKIIIIQRIMVK